MHRAHSMAAHFSGGHAGHFSHDNMTAFGGFLLLGAWFYLINPPVVRRAWRARRRQLSRAVRRLPTARFSKAGRLGGLLCHLPKKSRRRRLSARRPPVGAPIFLHFAAAALDKISLSAAQLSLRTGSALLQSPKKSRRRRRRSDPAIRRLLLRMISLTEQRGLPVAACGAVLSHIRKPRRFKRWKARHRQPSTQAGRVLQAGFARLYPAKKSRRLRLGSREPLSAAPSLFTCPGAMQKIRQSAMLGGSGGKTGKLLFRLFRKMRRSGRRKGRSGAFAPALSHRFAPTLSMRIRAARRAGRQSTAQFGQALRAKRPQWTLRQARSRRRRRHAARLAVQ